MDKATWRQKHAAMRELLYVRSPRGRRPQCHPDKPYAARGQCWLCYQRWYRAQRRMEVTP